MEEVREQHWYALKIFFNKVFEMEALLDHKGLDTYLAVEKVLLKGAAHLSARRKLADVSAPKDFRYIEEGALIYFRRPLVTSLLFVRCTPEQILEVEALLKEPTASGGARGYIYRNTEREFARIPENQMAAFRLVVESGVSGLEFFADDDIDRFRRGDRVRVKEGPLKGAEGYIKRIRKDRRLLVVINGVIAVATTYIPPQQLEKVV